MTRIAFPCRMDEAHAAARRSGRAVRHAAARWTATRLRSRMDGIVSTWRLEDSGKEGHKRDGDRGGVAISPWRRTAHSACQGAVFLLFFGNSQARDVLSTDRRGIVPPAAQISQAVAVDPQAVAGPIGRVCHGGRAGFRGSFRRALQHGIAQAVIGDGFRKMQQQKQREEAFPPFQTGHDQMERRATRRERGRGRLVAARRRVSFG